MAKLLFRNSFASRYKLGNRRKHLSERTKKVLSVDPSILIIDINYLSKLIESRQKYSKIKIDCKKYVLLWINGVSKLILPKGILAVCDNENSDTVNEIKSCLISYGITVIITQLSDFLYTSKINGKLSDPCCLITNNLSTWAVSNDAANLSFVAIDSNNRPLLYNNKTGLDFFCRFIMTNKVINKLGLQNIKYMNLQYLYILLLYLNFTNQSKTESFYFDSEFILSLPKHKKKGKPFSRSNGIGLELVAQAHKFISYAFLTKPEFTDLFLFSFGGDYNLHLARLQKLLPMDLQVLDKLHSFYNNSYKLTSIPVPEFVNTILCSSPDLYCSHLWAISPLKPTSLKEIQGIISLLNSYLTLYPNASVANVTAILPPSSLTALKVRPTTLPEPDDTTYNESDSYISTLLAGIFNG